MDGVLLGVVLAFLVYRIARGLRHGAFQPSFVALLVCASIGAISGWSLMNPEWSIMYEHPKKYGIISGAWWSVVIGCQFLGLAILGALLLGAIRSKGAQATFLALDLQNPKALVVALFLAWGLALLVGIGF